MNAVCNPADEITSRGDRVTQTLPRGAHRAPGGGQSAAIAIPGLRALRRRILDSCLPAVALSELAQSLGPAHTVAIDEDLFQDGSSAPGCSVVLDGLLCAYKLLPDGRRQILSFLIPGDIIGLEASATGHTSYGVAALTTSDLASIRRPWLNTLQSGHPALARFMWHDAFSQNAAAHEWLASLGQRRGYERIAHLFCTMLARYQRADLVTGESLPWAVSQRALADAVGLSAGHVNRIIQHLRAKRLITLGPSRLTIHNLLALQNMAGLENCCPGTPNRAGDQPVLLPPCLPAGLGAAYRGSKHDHRAG